MEFYDMENLSEQERPDVISTYMGELKRVSKNNDTIKFLRDIAKGKTEQDQAIVSGISMLESVLSSDLKIHHLIFCPEDIYTVRAQQVIYEASKKAENVLCVNASTLELLNIKKTANSMAAHISLPFKKIGEIKRCGIYVVLDGLELAGNIGTVMRTADGAGLSGVIITNPKVRMNNPTLLAASRAAFAHLDIVIDDVESITDWAAQNDIDIILADTAAKEVYTKADFGSNVCFVIGSERYGIDELWYKKEHRTVKVPMLGQCDSLNAGVAASLFIYEALRRQTD